jgi:hypothetical protein
MLGTCGFLRLGAGLRRPGCGPMPLRFSCSFVRHRIIVGHLGSKQQALLEELYEMGCLVKISRGRLIGSGGAAIDCLAGLLGLQGTDRCKPSKHDPLRAIQRSASHP